MTRDDEALFNEWFNRQDQSAEWDLRQELVKYCEADVIVLQRGCCEFMRLFMEKTGINPFTSNIALASVCARILREKFMPPHSVGIIPSGGYVRRQTQSHMAKCWLSWIEHTENIELETAFSPTGERRIGPYKADGYHSPSRTVYEFAGCVVHSCIHCVRDPAAQNPITKNKNYETREQFMDRTRFLEQQGLRVNVQWECQFRQALQSDSRLRDFCAQVRPRLTIEPRSYFFGGRVECSHRLFVTQPGEKIVVLDVNSLYPKICKAEQFPRGHPAVITRNFSFEPNFYFGVVLATVVPPSDLFWPVLPVRVGGRLMFPLCRSCVENGTQGECNHTVDADRALTGSWCTPEFYLALQYGYRIVEIHQVFHYDKRFASGQLFGGYIDLFLAMKTEASGFPPYVQTPAEKDAYVRRIEQTEGIQLGTVEYNAGRRLLAKLCLNSVYGYLGLRPDKVITKFVDSLAEYLSIWNNSTVKVTDVHPILEEVCMVSYRPHETLTAGFARGNDIIAAFVTSAARVLMYRHLARYQENVLYLDTDSLFLVVREGTELPTIGGSIGEWSYELKSEYATHFMCLAPKSYCLIECDGTVHYKLKGLRLTSENVAKLTPELFEQMLDEQEDGVEFHHQFHIRRDKYRGTMRNQPLVKRLKVVHSKRFRDGAYKLFPFGFCRH